MRAISALLGLAIMIGGAPLSAKSSHNEDDPPEYAFEAKELRKVTSDRLETFSNDADIVRYLEKLDDIKMESDADWANAGHPIIVAASMVQDVNPPADVCSDPAICPEEDDAASTVVATASRVSAPSAVATSITNVQSLGVDEGDIVKQIGNYLLVLQDGRIFTINIKDMKVTDRKEVYRLLSSKTPKKRWWEDDFEGADWYDEMLVRDDHIIVTAYSYDDDATEISIFRLDQTNGKVESRGVFLMSSDDYYSGDNYATRIVGDKLIVYNSYALEDMDFEDTEERPVLFRWFPDYDRKDAQKKGKPLLNAREIYKPILRTADPTIHAISVCSLGEFVVNQIFDCTTTGFTGPGAAEMFVSPHNIYLWNAAIDDEWINVDECFPDHDWDQPFPALKRAKRRDVVPGAVYRMSIRSGDVDVIGVNGTPFDQFSMEESGNRFRALVDWRTVRCEDSEYAPAELAYLSIRSREFGKNFLPVRKSRFTVVPPLGKAKAENRFTDKWLIYGGRERYGSRPPEPPEELPESADAGDIVEHAEEVAAYDRARTARVVAVPVNNPRKAKVIDFAHSVIRVERVGADMIVNGYHDDRGLNLTLIELGKSPKIASSLYLANRFESEGRSHAFNSMIDSEGNGVLGIPTVRGEEGSSRYAWRSDASDISFASKDSTGNLTDAGALAGQKEADIETHEDYACEVSCIDWYGNSRPIFTGGRIFGLMGTALVEAKMINGKVKEVARLELTNPIPGVEGLGKRVPHPDDAKRPPPRPPAEPIDEPIYIGPSREY
ncbi:MAG: beta-propeller domain-containing protein [Parasphingorhabdus sp.]|uniref:beta-propeller domain-containing protein n=1 Tax=Parasphingorhabdus sp. TaxID=2709688 RepID=UPI003298DFDC